MFIYFVRFMKKLFLFMTQETRILLIAICHMLNKLFVYSKQMTNHFKELLIVNLFPYISTRFDTFSLYDYLSLI
jgi:hypothetical protein